MNSPSEKGLPQALIALGANLPCDGLPPEDTIIAAIAALAGEGLHLHGFSGLYRTPCFPAGAGPDYVNAAAAVSGRLLDDVAAVLAALHRVEARFGRQRQSRWGMRTLDIDLLAVGDSVLPDADTQDHWRTLPPLQQAQEAPGQLILPHPRLQDRAFVLVPLAQVAPDWVHPRLRQSVTRMLAALPQADRDAVVPL
ncbi:MAG: 2-amino-4-hydroxy-6-hydroxymethyldihydropteridine diphosphokinase [Paracoccaceae bacterium]